MAVNILLKRSATASKRPVGASMAFGELNLNYDAATGGLYYKDSAGGVVKVGPCQVSETAPNSTAEGSTGNSAGEFWYDSSTNTLKVYNGTAWVESGGAVDSVTGTAPITVDNTDPLNPIVGISAASTTAPGAVQLNDTTSSSSITEALTANQGRNLQEQINALSVSSNLTLAGTLDASTGNLVTVTTEGAAQGFVIGGPLPSPAAGNAEFFVIATVGASSYTPPGGSATQVHIGDWFLSSGTVWEFLDVGFQAAYASTTTPGVVQLATDAEVQAGVETTHAVTPSGLQSKVSDSVSTTSSTTLASSTAVKAAYDAGVQGQTDAAAAQATADAALPKAGGTMTGNITFSDAGEGVVFSDASSVVAISDSTSTTSSTTAASSTAVKTAKDAADAAQSDATQALSDAAAAQATADQAVLDAAAAQATADAAIPQSGGSLTGELLVDGGYITTPAGDPLFISSGGTTDLSGERVLIQSGSSDPNAINFVSANGGVRFDSATSIGLNLAEDLQINGDGGLAGYILQSNGSGAAPTWVPQSEGGVTGVTGTAPITVDNTDPQNPVVGIDAASTSAAGAVQLNDTVTSTSDTEAATANAAKTAYDAAVAAQGDATQALADAAAAQADATQALADAAAAQATADAAIPDATFTALGDLIAGTGNGTYLVLPVGSNGQSLVACSDTATGLCWATAADISNATPTTVGGVKGATTGANSNVALGAQALNSIGAGSNNTAIGCCAAATTTIGTNNTAIGAYAFKSNGLAHCNTAVGAAALCTSTAGQCNTAVGAGSLLLLGSGNCNTAVGSAALRGVNGAGCNVGVGSNSLCLTTFGNRNVAIGVSAMAGNTSGTENVALGFCSLPSISIGQGNIAIGSCGLFTLGSGSNNVSLGHFAGCTSTTGSFNVVIGGGVQLPVTTGSCQLAIGFGADYWLTGCSTGAIKPAKGIIDCAGSCGTAGQVLMSNGSNAICWGTAGGGGGGSPATPTVAGIVFGCTSANSTALGCDTLLSLTSGTLNTAIGRATLSEVTTGSRNVALGGGAGQFITTGSRNLILGHGTNVPDAAGDCQLAIGVSGSCWLSGDSNFAVKPGAGIIDCAGSCGSVGQVLCSTGSNAIQWATPQTSPFVTYTTAPTSYTAGTPLLVAIWGGGTIQGNVLAPTFANNLLAFWEFYLSGDPTNATTGWYQTSQWPASSGDYGYLGSWSVDYPVYPDPNANQWMIYFNPAANSMNPTEFTFFYRPLPGNAAINWQI